MRRVHPHHPPPCIAALVVAIIVVMTACADDTPDDPPGASAEPGAGTFAEAVTATRAVASGRVELQTSVPGPAGPVAIVHRAAFTDGGLRAQATSDMSQVAAALDAAGQPLDGDWSQPSGVVVDGDTVYSQLGPMAEAFGHAADDWTSARLADVVDTGADNDALVLALDPLGPLDLLRRPVVEIGRVGDDDDVRGVPTQHLHARLDLTGSGTSDPAGGSFEERLVAAGLETLPVDVWVDDDGLVRRLVVTVDAAGSMTTTFEVYDTGADVTVAVPEAASIISPPTDDDGGA
jgi:hypothetical protein